ncbi:hypothetical protein [Symmachiella dynata]|uniref:hypothetical protein n=1 Tax=Symmachiella dynata TaxID=2527995 RepID=UPI0030EF485D|tara:strand:+ start:223 stop:387 length:165 start_codon:yes stop_codon:yes gene_type:complete
MLTDRQQLICPWELCREIADWLPPGERVRALRIIEWHWQRLADIERRELAEGAD